GEHASDRLQALTEPRTLADLATQWCVYDGASRYRRSIGGTTASIAALTVDAVRTFWRTRYTPGTLTVVVTGDIEITTAERVATRLVEGWEVAEPEPRSLTTAPRHTSPTLHLVHRADAPQSELRIARVAVPRVHPTFFAHTLMN